MMLTWSSIVSLVAQQKSNTGYRRHTLHSKKITALFLILISLGLSGQNPDQPTQPLNNEEITQEDIESLDEYVQLNQELPAEKIFLHLDRPNYMQGDTIWFKAYLWHGYDQVPDTISGVLYVDLISSQGRVLLKRKLLIQNGTARGDFSLDSTITSGNYYVRAYTRLMHNSKMGEPFYQTVTINPSHQNFHFECVPVIKKQPGNDSLQMQLRFFEIDPSGNLNSLYHHDLTYTLRSGGHIIKKGTIQLENNKEYHLSHSLGDQTILDSLVELSVVVQDDRVSFSDTYKFPLQEHIDVQFFPEGGRLVQGLQSLVAFKAIGPDGLGREVRGEIKTEDDRIVTRFSSTHKGMGVFKLIPKANEEYAAHIWFNRRKYVIPLPEASATGMVMTLSYLDNANNPTISIKRKSPKGPEPVYIVGNSNGKIWFSVAIKSFMDSIRIELQTDLLPEGVSRITILNGEFYPDCERLVYVNKDQGFEIEISPDSGSYKPRSKVSLEIMASDFGLSPVQSELSIAVLDREQRGHTDVTQGIKSFKLLESELQGFIEDPGVYYENGSWAEMELLNLLLLTHGYRKFAPINPDQEHLIFQPERSFDITGKIALTSNKLRAKNYDYQSINLLLLCTSKDGIIVYSHPDSAGDFAIQLPLMSGKHHFILQAETARGKPFKGSIILNEPNTISKFNSITLKSNSVTSTTIEFVRQIQSATKTERSRPSLPDSIAWSQTLEEVTVTAKVKEWYKRYEHDATKIIGLDTLDPNGTKYRTIYDLLVKEFDARLHIYNEWRYATLPCIVTTGAPGAKRYKYYAPIYVIDGETFWNGAGWDGAPLKTLASYPVNEIKRILVMPPMHYSTMQYASPDLYGSPLYIRQSMVVIESYSKNTYRGTPQGIRTFIRDGLDTPREFYSPQYDGHQKKRPIFDGRATLYWNPTVYTDVNGQATVEFYTSDRQTTLDVIVNGIEVESGDPGQGHTQIKVSSEE